MRWQELIEKQSQLAARQALDPSRQTLIPLPGQRLIRVAGEEAGSFLQNLLTNDVNALGLFQAQLSGFCNPKGRLLSIFQLLRREQDYLIVLPADLADLISQRLTLFKLRSKVDISLADDLVVLGLIDPATAMSPAAVWQGEQRETLLLIRQPGVLTRSLLIAEAENDINALLQQDWQLGSEAQWQLQEIESGLPMVFTDSKEVFTPQQVNLDLAGGVSFKKGCYPGQEVVARLHYLGKPSRRLFLGKLSADALPDINSPVTDDSGETLGHIVQAQFSDETQIVCQISLKLSARDKNAFVGEKKLDALTALVEETEAD